MNAGVDTALFLGNPIGAALWGLNKMTANEENPEGRVPLMKNMQKTFNAAGDWLTGTTFGQEMVKLGTGFHRNVIKPVTDTSIGETFMDLARLPLTVVEGAAGVVTAGYEKMDSALFKGKLPGGAEKGKEVDFTDMVKARTVDPLVANIEDLFGQDKATELAGIGPEDMVIDPVPTTAGTREATDNELLKAFGKDLDTTLTEGYVRKDTDTVLDFETTFPDEHELPDIETPIEQRILDAKHPPAPDITENWVAPSHGSAEWFAETPMEMLTVKLPYGEVATPHMVVDGTSTPVQAMPEFWDWLDGKRASLGRDGFRNYVAKQHGAKGWQYTPHFRYLNWDNPSEYLRKYSGNMTYTKHIHRWVPMVQTFYNEMVKEGVTATAPPEADGSANAGQQVANVAATMAQADRGQTLMNALSSQPSWRYEQFSTPSTGANTLPSIGVRAIRN
jgi:hypothetical protein